MQRKKKLRLGKVIAAMVLAGILCFGSTAYAVSVSRGQYLANPAEGWTRYDDFEPGIEYSSSFYINNASWLYCSRRHDEAYKGGQIKFAFYGTSIALLDYIYDNRSQNSTINIDNGAVVEKCAAYGGHTDCYTVFYAKEGLKNKVHNVVIDIPYGDGCFCLDAIDVNKGGYILPYGQYTNKEILDIDTNKNQAAVNDEVTADVNISRIDNMTLEDMTITYDSSKLKYLGTRTMDGVRILKNKGSEGSLRIVCKGPQSKSSLKTALLQLRFKAKAPGNAYITVDEADVSNGLGSIKSLSGEECGDNVINIK